MMMHPAMRNPSMFFSSEEKSRPEHVTTAVPPKRPVPGPTPVYDPAVTNPASLHNPVDRHGQGKGAFNPYAKGKGFWMDEAYYPAPPIGPHNLLKFLHDYKLTNKDLIVNTFAKAGTTWMLWTAFQVLSRGESMGDRHIDDLYNWRECLDFVQNGSHPKLEDLPTVPRLLKSHATADTTPFSKDAKYIYVCRDPADCLVSFAKMRSAIGVDISLAGYVEYAQTGPHYWGGWATSVAGWWKLAEENKNVLFVFFQDMKDDFAAVLKKICSFLEVELSEEEKERVMLHCSFKFMKENASMFQLKSLSNHGKDLKDFQFINKGGSGNGKAGLSEISAEELYISQKAQLAQLGSSFPYERFYKGK